jgi:hypothetical protein
MPHLGHRFFVKFRGPTALGDRSRLKAGCSQDWLPHKVLWAELYDEAIWEGAFIHDAAEAAGGAAQVWLK